MKFKEKYKVGLRPTSKQGKPKAYNLLHVNSPSQIQGACETNLRLLIKAQRRPLGCDLVKIFAS